MPGMDKKGEYRVLALEEKRLLDFFHNTLQWGEAHVIVKRGLPVFVKVAYKDVKLD
jgi:hypothetical protein